MDQDRDPLPLEILSPCKKYNAMKFLLRNLIGMGAQKLEGQDPGVFLRIQIDLHLQDGIHGLGLTDVKHTLC